MSIIEIKLHGPDVLILQSSPMKHALAGSVLLALLVFLRLLFASGEAFSYDYDNYLAFFENIREMEWSDILEVTQLSFPYVLVPGGGKFELAFVILVRGIIGWLDPIVTYALLAGLSIGLRSFAMRQLGLSWSWLVVTQVYAITVFEANALRAGLALSLTLLGLLFVLRGRLVLALLAFSVACLEHLQAVIFIFPFIGFSLLPKQWLNRWWIVVGVLIVTVLATLVAMDVVSTMEVSKLEDYVGSNSGAVGFNLTSMLSMCLVLSGFVFALCHDQRCLMAKNASGYDNLGLLWLRSLMASVPALMLLLFGINLSAVGDRAWQFSIVILVTLSTVILRTDDAKKVRNFTMTLLMAVLLINTLIRYPLSNFFAPPLPYERIVPMSFVT